LCRLGSPTASRAVRWPLLLTPISTPGLASQGRHWTVSEWVRANTASTRANRSGATALQRGFKTHQLECSESNVLNYLGTVLILLV
jgi:hypothetical protein